MFIDVFLKIVVVLFSFFVFTTWSLLIYSWWKKIHVNKNTLTEVQTEGDEAETIENQIGSTLFHDMLDVRKAKMGSKHMIRDPQYYTNVQRVLDKKTTKGNQK